MKITNSVKDRLIQDCKDFYENFKTLNDISIKKHYSSLSDRVKKYYGDLSVFRKDCNDLPPDNGTRIWTHNNECLKNKNFPHIDHSVIGPFPDSVESLKNAILDLLCINEEVEISYSKCGIAHFFLPGFERTVVVLEDEHRGELYNKSNYAFTKYKKDLKDVLKQFKNSIVIEFYDKKIFPKDLFKQLSSAGLSLYSKFRFLSVDPPTKRHLGYCVMEYDNGNIKIIESGTHLIDNTYSRSLQIKVMGDFIEKKLTTYSCSYFISESAFGFGQENVRTLLSENVGVFQYLGELYSVPFITISPKRFKLYVIGDDKADKEKTIRWAKKRFKLKEIVLEHEADAIAIAIAFLTDRELLDLCDWK